MSANPQLLSYIKKTWVQGYSKEEIKNTLLSSNWPEEEINLALSEIPDPEALKAGNLLRTAFLKFKKLWKPLISVWVIELVASMSLGVILLPLVLTGRPDYSSQAMRVPSRYRTILLLSQLIAEQKWLEVSSQFIVFGLSLLMAQYFAGVTLLIIRKKEPVSVKRCLLEARAYLWSLFSLGILYSLLSLSGLILFIIPGIIISLYFFFYDYVIVFENKRGFEVFKRAKSLVKKEKLFNMFGKIFLGNLIGAIPIVGKPFRYLYFAALFDNLQKKASFESMPAHTTWKTRIQHTSTPGVD